MLKSEQMLKLRIVAAKANRKNIIKKLHELGVLHIVEHKKTEELDIGMPDENSEKISEILVKINSLLSGTKKIEADTTKKNEKIVLTEMEKVVNEIETEIVEKKSKTDELNKDRSEKQEILEKLEVLNNLYLNLESYLPLKSVTAIVGTIKGKEVIKNLKEKIAKITSKNKLHVSENGKHTAIALFIERDKQEEAEELLKKYSFVQLDLEFIEGMKGLPVTHISRLNSEIQKLKAKKEKLIEAIISIKTKHKKELVNYRNQLSIEADRAAAPLKFGETKDATLITGWVPKSKHEETKKEIDTITKNKVLIENLNPEAKESIPIKLKNNLLIKPFEFFMRLYTLPNYKEIDPSFLIFITFPIFFGFMLGDVGYGILTLLLFWSLKKVVPAGKDLLNSMMACSYWTIIFGLVFGEYLGFERLTINGILHEFPRLINRMHGSINIMGNDIHLVLVLGAIVGFVHINLSIFFGFLNEWKNHGIKEGILAKLSWFIFEAGLILVTLNALNILRFPIYGSVALIVLSIVMIYLGEGVQGLVEIPAIFSNMLSYLRLGAVGLASVGLAVVVNEQLAMPFLEKGGWFILVAILILILGHSINIALGIIGPFLHSIRLHYVEFFARFYKGGGKPYKPFGLNDS
ncbi:V-type ATP synthase subunit I [Candidatus Woesearchaeota archaeon]|jgi:V/A-type H+/Na+-transporting ATPase subunit I|nr:V-type ATP synthase subunit I [Candidatus Woesearchaeota archaeon]MBT5273043.1 V-type ATP synthase subunit I [Candidatus Woesearchaeota archaeon]MBT6040821.1 V-type ATP synthase subunit I [Candidatus Woesearchaeota archaeon]MBT6337642.1 V-type ATP synthase subunit I [Candidatus Woesearchaeota archaeon]MBT7926957.1 V-type ATP synthase subunit I [Candidatus Woesearchaeota archaeon]